VRGKREAGRLSVFKGREARLNRAIFHILALKGQLSIYDIPKEVKAQRTQTNPLPNVNKRVRALEESGYINKIGIKKTRAGFQASIYELATKAYLAMVLNSTNRSQLLIQVDEDVAQTILASILSCEHFHD